jgi:hypothetical protein
MRCEIPAPVPSVPDSSVAIEVNQHCNRRCHYCPVSRDLKPAADLGWSLFSRIIDQLDELRFDGTLKYHLFNEPLLNPHLEALVAHATERLPRAKSVIYTNGDALTRKRAQSLFAAGVRRFVVTDHGGRAPRSVVKEAQRRIRTPWSTVWVRTIGDSAFLFNRGGLVDIARARQFDYCAYPAYEAVIDIAGTDSRGTGGDVRRPGLETGIATARAPTAARSDTASRRNRNSGT